MLLYQSSLARDLGKPVFGLKAIALRGRSVKVNHCAKKLITWYDEHYRPLPWHQKVNIYHTISLNNATHLVGAAVPCPYKLLICSNHFWNWYNA